MKFMLTALAAFGLCGQVHATVNFDSAGTGLLQGMDGQVFSAPAPTPEEVIFYVKADGTQVFQTPAQASGDSDILAELRGGERVKVLAKSGDFYKVSINRREYDPKTGQWGNTQGWVSAESVGVDAPDSDSLTIPTMSQDQSSQTGGCRGAFIDKLKVFADQRVPYVWGGTSHKGVDCSGLVVAAMLESGCVSQTPPRTAADQQKAAAPRESLDQMQPGDLIFVGKPAHHVIVFLGKDESGNYSVEEAPNKGSVVNIHSYQPSDEYTFGALLQ